MSFRARLALWNSLALAVVLVGFGLVMALSIQGQMGRSIDQDLHMRGDRFQFGPQPPPGEGGPLGPPNGNQDPGMRRGPDGLPPDEPRPPMRQRQQGQGQPGGPFAGGMRPPIDPETEKLAELRRPRFLGRDGKSVLEDGVTEPLDPATFKRSLQGEPVFSTVTFDGEHLRVYSLPWRNGPNVVGVVQLSRELREQDRLWADQIKTLLLLIPLALVLAGVGGWFLTGRILKPVREVTEAASAIGEEDLSRRLDVQGKDELAQLALTFNAMIERLESAFQGREEAYRKLEAAFEQQRRFTADASHELRTPLTRIKISTSAALMGEPALEEFKQALITADQAADEMSKLIQDLLVLARVDAGQLRLRSESVDLGELAEEVVSGMPPRATPIAIDRPRSAVYTMADRDLLKRVLANLLDNAVRHTPSDKPVSVVLAEDESDVSILVKDEGEGVAAEHLPHLAERFYRVDAARNRADGGLGLGLAICKSIVEAHGGTLAFESEPGHGLQATIRLPKK